MRKHNYCYKTIKDLASGQETGNEPNQPNEETG